MYFLVFLLLTMLKICGIEMLCVDSMMAAPRPVDGTLTPAFTSNRLGRLPILKSQGSIVKPFVLCLT